MRGGLIFRSDAKNLFKGFCEERQEEMERISSQRSAVSHKRRKAKSKKRSIITTTYRSPKWQKGLQAGWKGFKRQAWNVLGGVGIITVIVLVAQAIGR